ncbi:4Fe-4S dicluster domain-containing protein [Acidobacteriota bacterium]
MKGAVLSVQDNLETTIIDFLKETLERDLVQAVIVPKRVPSGDSFAYLVVRDPAILEGASPLPPVIPVQGANAVSSLTRTGKNQKKILAVMHPCEIRAAIELNKLKQADLDNLLFLSFDCPGVMPLSLYSESPEKNDQIFGESFQDRNSESMRPVCRMCTEFSRPASDIHIGLLGAEEGKVYLSPVSPEGERVMNSLDLKLDFLLEGWEKEVEALKNERRETRKTSYEALSLKIKGPDKLAETFSGCINCHNCMRVCPICYCRQCYFESDALKLPPENYLLRAEKKGSLRLPAETLFFHLGRMSHMILSCVSCGACEDACPMDIPVAQVFSLVADDAQRLFNYEPGRDKQEPLPTVVYREEEFREVEKPYSETYLKGESKNV